MYILVWGWVQKTFDTGWYIFKKNKCLHIFEELHCYYLRYKNARIVKKCQFLIVRTENPPPRLYQGPQMGLNM